MRTCFLKEQRKPMQVTPPQPSRSLRGQRTELAFSPTLLPRKLWTRGHSLNQEFWFASLYQAVCAECKAATLSGWKHTSHDHTHEKESSISWKRLQHMREPEQRDQHNIWHIEMLTNPLWWPWQDVIMWESIIDRLFNIDIEYDTTVSRGVTCRFNDLNPHKRGTKVDSSKT